MVTVWPTWEAKSAEPVSATSFPFFSLSTYWPPCDSMQPFSFFSPLASELEPCFPDCELISGDCELDGEVDDCDEDGLLLWSLDCVWASAASPNTSVKTTVNATCFMVHSSVVF